MREVRLHLKGLSKNLGDRRTLGYIDIVILIGLIEQLVKKIEDRDKEISDLIQL